MTKKIIKVISVLLVLLFLLTATLSCTKKDDPSADVSSADSVGDVANADESASEGGDGIRYDANGYQMDNLPEDLNFNGKEIRIFAHPQSYDEFEIETDEINASVLQTAVYRRNIKTEARTGTKLVFVMETPSAEQSYTIQLENTQLSSSDACTLFASYSMTASELMLKGYITDLKKQEYLDFSAPWWSQGLVDKATLYDRLYFCSGDISPMLFGQTFIMYFNKDMVERYVDLAEYDAESLYDMVYDKTWTIDNMMKMCKGVGYSEDNIKDADDIYGFTVNAINGDGFYQAAGLDALEYNPDGSARVSDDMSSEKAISLVEKLVDFYKSPDAMCNEKYTDGSEYVPGYAWERGHAMFFTGLVMHATIYQEKGLDFGILPLPKWDVDQENYYSISGFPYSMWSLARAAKGEDAEASAAVLECLASESYRTVAPALYTTILREQASSSSADYEMWNTIKASVTIEGGRCFDSCTQGMAWKIFRHAIMDRTGDYASYYATYVGQLEGNITSMNSVVATLEEVYGG